MTLASIQYDLTVVGGALTVKQAPLTLTTSDVVKTYDGTTLAAASALIVLDKGIKLPDGVQ